MSFKNMNFHKNNLTFAKFIKNNLIILFVALIIIMFFTACATPTKTTKGGKYSKSYVIKGKRYYILKSAAGYQEKGLASWYGHPFHGRKTANGETYNMNKISAAHKSLPLNTWVEVRNLKNKRTMVMRINDRGPFIEGRIIDLSKKAAEVLGVIGPGTAPVAVKAISPKRAEKLQKMALEEGQIGDEIYYVAYDEANNN